MPIYILLIYLCDKKRKRKKTLIRMFFSSSDKHIIETPYQNCCSLNRCSGPNDRENDMSVLDFKKIKENKNLI